jgi:mono/diheme cytochrome c family protein
MPAFADLLTPEQIAELVQQIREWGQAGAAQPR